MSLTSILLCHPLKLIVSSVFHVVILILASNIIWIPSTSFCCDLHFLVSSLLFTTYSFFTYYNLNLVCNVILDFFFPPPVSSAPSPLQSYISELFPFMWSALMILPSWYWFPTSYHLKKRLLCYHCFCTFENQYFYCIWWFLKWLNRNLSNVNGQLLLQIMPANLSLIVMWIHV